MLALSLVFSLFAQVHYARRIAASARGASDHLGMHELGGLSQVVDGEDADIRDLPFAVQIGFFGVGPWYDWTGFCSGSLISSGAVLTAAHCVYNPDGSLKLRSNSGLWVMYNSNSSADSINANDISKMLEGKTSHSRNFARVKEVHDSRGFQQGVFPRNVTLTGWQNRYNRYDDDVAILILDKCLDGVQPLRVATANDTYDQDCKKATILGWGHTQTTVLEFWAFHRKTKKNLKHLQRMDGMVVHKLEVCHEVQQATMDDILLRRKGHFEQLGMDLKEEEFAKAQLEEHMKHTQFSGDRAFCLGGNRIAGLCHGDSGGPVVVQDAARISEITFQRGATGLEIEDSTGKVLHVAAGSQGYKLGVKMGSRMIAVDDHLYSPGSLSLQGDGSWHIGSWTDWTQTITATFQEHQFVQIGISAYVWGICATNPDMATRVSFYAEWIHKALSQHDACRKNPGHNLADSFTQFPVPKYSVSDQDIRSHCQRGEWQCPGDGDCIPEQDVCNGVKDCHDGQDELDICQSDVLGICTSEVEKEKKAWLTCGREFYEIYSAASSLKQNDSFDPQAGNHSMVVENCAAFERCQHRYNYELGGIDGIVASVKLPDCTRFGDRSLQFAFESRGFRENHADVLDSSEYGFTYNGKAVEIAQHRYESLKGLESRAAQKVLSKEFVLVDYVKVKSTMLSCREETVRSQLWGHRHANVEKFVNEKMRCHQDATPHTPRLNQDRKQ